jgi:hypothetical protein
MTDEQIGVGTRDSMRKLTDHIVSGDQAVQLQVEATDEPGEGGAHHRYEITGFDATSNASAGPGASFLRSVVLFQNGPRKYAGANGITHEALLAIMIDRLRAYNAGPFKCPENAVALMRLNSALWWLKKRTELRIKRGVEGTHEK